jgi:hypothetical protein
MLSTHRSALATNARLLNTRSALSQGCLWLLAAIMPFFAAILQNKLPIHDSV